LEVILFDNHFELLPERAIFWKERSALILSDLHTGKGMHFRKEGIPIPKNAFDADLDKLNGIINRFSPELLIVVGDMFHSHHNNEIKLFDIWRSQYDQLAIALVKGNHDILSATHYHDMDIDLLDTLIVDDFIFSHHLINDPGHYCFHGHIHPGIRIRGNARQTLKFPCFYFTETFCTLPAFSAFTGLYLVEPTGRDHVYAILPDRVVKV
jgi:DNA ligase-associated metallophosphoesterase